MSSLSILRRNHLYTLRRIRGLRQKQLAHLLGYRGTAMISRFESGVSLPSLKVGFLIEIVLGARLADVYLDLYHELERVALKRARVLPPHLSRQLRGRILGKDDDHE